MFPVVVAKADSIHCLQGVTVGDKHPLKNILLHWSEKAEANWANILYVGISRAEKLENIAFIGDFNEYSLRKIGSYSSVLKQKTEMQELTTLALNLRNTLNVTTSKYIDSIQWFINMIREKIIINNNTNNSETYIQNVIIINACLDQWENSINNYLANI